jgi:hypothetical protein
MTKTVALYRRPPEQESGADWTAVELHALKSSGFSVAHCYAAILAIGL